MKYGDVYTSLSTRLANETGLLMGWVWINHPMVAALLAREADVICLDMQHGQMDVATTTISITQVLMAGKPAIVRIPIRDFATASRMLDAGASGIIAPMINSVEDARALVEYTKYDPIGGRSWGPGGTLLHTGFTNAEYLEIGNKSTVVIAMIETRQALDALDDILAVDGIDGVFVGPSDLSLSLSHGDNIDATRPDVHREIEYVLERCRAHGKIASTYAIPPSRARELRQLGFHLIALGTDFNHLRQSMATMVAAARQP